MRIVFCVLVKAVSKKRSLIAMWGFGIGRHKTKLARFIGKYDYSIQEFSKATKVNRNTVGKLCNDSNYIPSPNTIKKIMSEIRRLDPNKKVTDFWDM